jgi:integrase
MMHGDATSSPPRRPWSRRYINAQVKRLMRMFKWTAAQEILPVTTYQQLRTLEPLRRGHCIARETEPVKPVSDELVNAVQPYVSRQVWALIELQRITGARPGELFGMRPMDLHRDASDVWAYTLTDHKTAHRGRTRTLYLGPRAQVILAPFLANRAPDVPLFSPNEAEAERRAEMHARRTTPLSCGNKPGSNRKPQRVKQLGTQYTTGSYARAILYGCANAFRLPPELARERLGKESRYRPESLDGWRKRLGERRWQEVIAFRKAHRWHPYQLRHSPATTIRKHFGLEAAQIALGHSSAQITDTVYAERDHDKAIAIMRQMG